MLGVVNLARQRKPADRLGQQVREVRHSDLFRNLRLRLLRRVNHMRLVFDERPLEALLVP